MLVKNLADRWLRTEVVRFVCWVCLAMTFVLTILIFGTSQQGKTSFGTDLGADYGAFYVVGLIQNEGQTKRLYDRDYQDEKLHQVLPLLSKDEHLPFVYPGFVCPIFRPLAALPFAWSVASWMAISIGLYVFSVYLVLKTWGPITPSDRKTAWLLALSFQPFSIECCLGGHISAIGFTALAVGSFFQHRKQPFLAGLMLSLLLYKPTLLLLIGPMLVLSRSWRILFGLAAGGLILAAISWLAVGFQGCLDYLNLLRSYGKMGGSVGDGFKTMKFVDLTAFLRLLGVAPAYSRPMAFLLGLPFLIGLVMAWLRTGRGELGRLTLAATIVFMPVLSIYSPIYDVTMIVPGILLAAGAIRSRSSDAWPDSFRWVLAFLYLTAMITQPSALKLGFQPLTLGILFTGAYFSTLALRQRSAIA